MMLLAVGGSVLSAVCKSKCCHYIQGVYMLAAVVIMHVHSLFKRPVHEVLSWTQTSFQEGNTEAAGSSDVNKLPAQHSEDGSVENDPE